MLEIKIEKFEGPLGLLLELIEKDKLDITEVSLSKVTDQYLTRISSLDPKNYDLTEFMTVAAKLIYLKSKALLPALETEAEEEEIEDLKEKLEIYKKYKDAATEFSNILSKNQRSFPAQKPKLSMPKFTPPSQLKINDLWGIFQSLLKDMPQELLRENLELPSEKITIESKLIYLQDFFTKKREISFKSIILNSNSKIDAIITFLALLEMIKHKKVTASQSKNFNDIKLGVVT